MTLSAMAEPKALCRQILQTCAGNCVFVANAPLCYSSIIARQNRKWEETGKVSGSSDIYKISYKSHSDQYA